MQWMSRYVHDGIELSKAIAVVAAKRRTTQQQQQQQVASELLKSVLLEQSSGPRPNKLAISILRIEQAYGLMKYMGFMEYTKQQIIPNIIRSTSSSNSNSNSNSNGNSISTNHDHDSNNKIKNNYQNKNTVAKIAFMVTSSMKRDLMDGLNYDENEIKKMTPKRASWVLHHRIDPTVYDAQISILEEEEEREEEQQRKILEQQQQQVQQEQIKEQQQQSKQQQQDLTKDIPSYNDSGSEKDDKVILQLQSSQRCNKTDEGNDNNRDDDDDIDELSIGAQKESALSSSSSPSLDRMANTSDNDSTITGRDGWYELVEVMKPSESETTTTPTNNHNNNDDNHGDHKTGADGIVVCRHGLYRTKEEAMIGLETRELIHNRNQKHHHRQHNNSNDNAQNIAETSEYKNSNSFLKKPKTTTTFFVRPISDEDIRK